MFGIEDGFPAPSRFFDAGDQLHELVAREIGSADFGDDDYLLPLRVLMESMDYDPQFTERGRTIAWGMLIMGLGSRGFAVDQMKRRPGFDAKPITNPVIVTGLHRTGTTALHRLLAVDQRFQGLEAWLVGAPMPRPPRESWDRHPMYEQMARRLAARFAGAVGMQDAHHMAAAAVDECCGILAQSFNNTFWSSVWSVATYDAWRHSQSEGSAYLYYRKCLQLIGSNEPDRRWLLKNPPHLSNLDLVFEMFPDARIIQTHRDPARSVPSLCSLLMTNHPLMEVGRNAERARTMGYLEVARAAEAIRLAEPVRQAHHDQILDVRHADFHRDPMGTVKRIYDFTGTELPEEIQARMQQHIAGPPESVPGAHRYRATDFGMTEDEIREQFGDYLDRFDLRSA